MSSDVFDENVEFGCVSTLAALTQGVLSHFFQEFFSFQSGQNDAGISSDLSQHWQFKIHLKIGLVISRIKCHTQLHFCAIYKE